MGIKKTFVGVLFATLLMSLAGCERDGEGGYSGYGTMNIQLSASSEVIELDASPEAKTRVSESGDGLLGKVATRTDEVVPKSEDFALFLLKGETVAKRWEKVTDLSDTEKIPVGEYTLKASYGDQKKEGFDSPYYEGSTSIRIFDKEDTSVDLTCYLACVQLTVNCSEAVQKYFKTFTMQARSKTGTPIDIAKTEIRSTYLQPGLLILEARLEKQNGTTSKLELLRIPTTEIRQHYIVNVEVNEGNVGSGVLNVTYHTVKSEEKVEIDLSDASLNIKEPEFTASGINSGDGVTLREGAQPDGLKLTLNARAGIRSCDLVVHSPYLNSNEVGIAQTIELVPTEEQGIAKKQKVVDKGLRLLGLEEDIEKLALIDFTQLVMNMLCTGDADETSTFTLRATDKRGVVQEQEFSFSTTLQSNQFSFPAFDKTVMIGGTEAEAMINLLTSGITGQQDVNNVIFEYKNVSGVWVTTETEWVSDDATEVKKHTVKIKKLPEVHRNLTLRARYGSKISAEQTLSYYIPEFKITAEPADIWARKATMKVEANTVAERDAVLKYLKLTSNGSEISTTKKDNTFLWTGLAAGQTYTVVGVCNDGGEVTSSKEYDLATENDTKLPNFDFEGEWKSGPHDGVPINWGGPWSKKDGALATWGKATYQQTAWDVKVPIGWETVNAKTMPSEHTQFNTWYVVPSSKRVSSITSADNGNYSMKITNVGWNDKGAEIALYGTTAWFGTYYETFPGFDKMNIPQSLNNSAGRLFLGSYSYDGSDHPVEGSRFTSRPSKMTFNYKYTSKTSGLTTDKGYVRVMLRKGTKSIFKDREYIEMDLDGTTNVLTKSLEFPYPSVGCEKPDNICVMFCSSTGGKNWLTTGEKIDNPNIASNENKAQACVTGSELYIDDIILEY